MDKHVHSMTALFDQLGLASSEQAIDAFIASHYPLPQGIALYQAEFWNEGQSGLLKQLRDEDADWSGIVDQLDTRLRNNPLWKSS